MWDQWVIDATLGCPATGIFCFCPVEGDISSDDYTIVSGMNFLSTRPPEGGKLVAIVHEDGQSAVEKFCHEHEAELAALE